MLITLAILLAVCAAACAWLYSRAGSVARSLADARSEADTLRRSEADAREKLAEASRQTARLEANLDAARSRAEAADAERRNSEATLREAHDAFVAELRAGADARINALTAQLAEAARRLDALTAARDVALDENARLSTSLAHFKAEAATREEQMKTGFQNLANEILRENSTQFKAQNAERLGEILSPLMTSLDEFKRAVADSREADTRERSALASTISQLRQLNDAVMQETRNLTSALRGNNKVQGDWGEMVLESILTASGLTEGREYELQATTAADGSPLRDDAGRALRPDVIVNYPDGSRLVIDAKTNLSHYFDSIDTDLTDEQRREASRRHAMAVRAQIDGLARRDYSAYVGGESHIDMVMMFIPNEPAYMTAMHEDGKLWEDAYRKKVLIVSPTHLVAALRLIKNLWVRNQVTTNALEIARIAGTMYDKFAAFTSDLEKIRTSLSNSSAALENAFSRLATGKGNLVRTAERLRALGAKTSKQMAATARDLSGLDLAEASPDEEE